MTTRHRLEVIERFNVGGFELLIAEDEGEEDDSDSESESEEDSNESESDEVRKCFF